MTLTSLPTPALPDPMAAPALRWGVLGTGWIAERFVGALQRHTNQHVTAVGSRTQEGAERFASAYGVRRAHPSYAQLVADPEVDVVYVATPHPNHLSDALLAIDAGKHVLVEKPLGLNAGQVRQLADAARGRGVFAMEALWTLFLPKFRIIDRLLADGVLGELVSVHADIGEWFDTGHRIKDPALAGGAMMDMATYPVTFATWVAGRPETIESVGRRGDTGIMDHTSMLMTTATGIEITLQASSEVDIPTTASIAGSSASLLIDRHFYRPGPFILFQRTGDSLSYDEPRIDHEGLFWQAVHAAHDIAEGRTESSIRPLGESLLLLETMDRVRARTGDAFTME